MSNEKKIELKSIINDSYVSQDDTYHPDINDIPIFSLKSYLKLLPICKFLYNKL